MQCLVVFIDLGGYSRFVPGTVTTLVSAAAVAVSFFAYLRRGKPVSTP